MCVCVGVCVCVFGGGGFLSIHTCFMYNFKCLYAECFFAQMFATVSVNMCMRVCLCVCMLHMWNIFKLINVAAFE